MKFTATLTLIFCTLHLLSQPIALHPENSHYLFYKGKPTLLITSAEHYGAVLNQEFDYKKYLQTMQEEGMNYTRIFTGSYVEVSGSFNINKNTLSPAVGQFLPPWKRVEDTGLYNGEKKFDLSEFNPAYFDRLRAFLSEAAARNIIVEITFFCATYNDGNWQRHPFNPENNVNKLGFLKRQDTNTLANAKVTDYQKALIQKIVKEVNSFDNIFFEISNEPWSDNGIRSLHMLKTLRPQKDGLNWAFWSSDATPETLAWQKEMAQTIVDAEKNLPKKHLIAQNYNNFKQSLPEIDPNISIINFHYAWPEAVEMNYGWNLPINFDESGFAGNADNTYLEQAWAFMLAGGAIFNNLDYSFFVGAEDGKGINDAPGGGSTAFRKQLKILRDFLESFDFIRMKPDRSLVQHAPGMEWQALAENKKQYAICFYGKPAPWVKLTLPKGKYHYQWISPQTGSVLSEGDLKSKGKMEMLSLKHKESILALRIIGK